MNHLAHVKEAAQEVLVRFAHVGKGCPQVLKRLTFVSAKVPRVLCRSGEPCRAGEPPPPRPRTPCVCSLDALISMQHVTIFAQGLSCHTSDAHSSLSHCIRGATVLADHFQDKPQHTVTLFTRAYPVSIHQYWHLELSGIDPGPPHKDPLPQGIGSLRG